MSGRTLSIRPHQRLTSELPLHEFTVRTRPGNIKTYYIMLLWGVIDFSRLHVLHCTCHSARCKYVRLTANQGHWSHDSRRCPISPHPTTRYIITQDHRNPIYRQSWPHANRHFTLKQIQKQHHFMERYLKNI
ncbi:hypothetical protein NQZ68_025941 [Dissostichus eleginoides]|nr:hypothetical protein NQZ68_025941 [Dissostichus eleginoides]